MLNMRSAKAAGRQTASTAMAVPKQVTATRWAPVRGTPQREAVAPSQMGVATKLSTKRMTSVISRVAAADPSTAVGAAEKVEGSIMNTRGQLLHTVTWYPPENVVPECRLFFHHGLGEHSGRYDHVFKKMAENGVVVHSYDAHGHGRSEPHEENFRAYIEDYRHLVDDLYVYIDSLIGDKTPARISSSLPLFLGGHSVGGLVATLGTLRREEIWNGLILHSAAINVEFTPAMKAMLPESAVLSRLLPHAHIVPAVRPEDMSQDPEVIKKAIEDPLNVKGRQSMRTATQLLEGFKFMSKNHAQLYLPIYAAHGDKDKCTSAKAVQDMLKNSTSEDVTMNMIEGGYHEMLHGPESEQCTIAMINWMNNHLQTGTQHKPDDKVIKSKGIIVNKRGQRLYNVTYKPSPTGAKPRARVFFHHGLGEHAGRYDKVFTEMAEAGLVVHAMDAHGHGRSEPMDPKGRCFIEDYNHLVDDMYVFIDSLTGRNTPPEYATLPLFMFGHSVGGLTATLTVLKRQEMWSGLLLHSAAINVEWTPALRLMARRAGILSKLFPHAKIVPAVRAEDMNSDPEAIRATVEDGLNASGKQQMRTSEQLMRAFQFLEPKSDQFKLPIYAAHGTNDKCTSIGAVEKLLKGSKSQDVILNGIEGGYHELLHGPERQVCTRKFVKWILDHSPQ